MTPVVVVAELPSRGIEGIGQIFSTREALQEEVSQLRQDMFLLQVKAQKMAAFIAENNRLRDLLGSQAKLQDNVVVAELMGVDPDPEKQEVIIDKGSSDGVFIGQPLLDAQGLMGQVIATSRFNSRVLLISDPSHSVPVQVARSNLRLVAQGTGVNHRLDLIYVQNTADVRTGDLLISSGLGKKFPVGYPVGVVNKVQHRPGQPFAEVTAVPSALLDRSRHVLLVFTKDRLANHQDTQRNGNGG